MGANINVDHKKSLLQRSARSSQFNNHNAAFQRSGPSSLSLLSRMNFHNGGTVVGGGGLENAFLNETSNNIDTVNLNPNLCYEVGGLSNGQKKLCVLHTSIMPAISRGARSAIQVIVGTFDGLDGDRKRV